MAKKFRYSHLKSTTPNAIPSANKLRDAEIAVNTADEKLFLKNASGEVTTFIDEKAIDEKLANKTDYIVNGGNGRALMFNESDGGGAKFEHNDGTWSFVGVNDGGQNGIAGQIYALKKNAENKFEGSRIDITNGAMYYTVTSDGAADRMVPENEIAVKGDITAATGDYFDGVEYVKNDKKIYFYNGTTQKAYVDATDFVIDGMIDSVTIEDKTIGGETVKCLVIVWNTDAGKEEVDIPLSEIFNPDNYYTKDETDALLAGKTDTATTAALNDVVTAHTANTDIHVTTAQTAAWDAKLDASDIATLTPSEKVLTNGGNVEISITDLSTSGEADVDEDNEGNIILEAGEF